MKEELLKLMLEYKSQGINTDKKLMDKIIEIVVNYQELNKYVRKISFLDKAPKEKEWFNVAEYQPALKKLIIHTKVLSDVLEESIETKLFFNPSEKNLYRNVMITQIMLHELEHANQWKTQNTLQDTSLEAQIIRACNIIDFALQSPANIAYAIKSGKGKTLKNAFFHDTVWTIHKMDPRERLAQIHSHQLIIELLKEIPEKTPFVYLIEHLILTKEYLKNYKEAQAKRTCPTEVYLYDIACPKEWQALPFYDEDTKTLLKNVTETLSLKKRLSLGLPISQEEYNKVKSQQIL